VRSSLLLSLPSSTSVLVITVIAISADTAIPATSINYTAFNAIAPSLPLPSTPTSLLRQPTPAMPPSKAMLPSSAMPSLTAMLLSLMCQHCRCQPDFEPIQIKCFVMSIATTVTIPSSNVALNVTSTWVHLYPYFMEFMMVRYDSTNVMSSTK
jgi:hypothetical protein